MSILDNSLSNNVLQSETQIVIILNIEQLSRNNIELISSTYLQFLDFKFRHKEILAKNKMKHDENKW